MKATNLLIRMIYGDASLCFDNNPPWGYSTRRRGLLATLRFSEDRRMAQQMAIDPREGEQESVSMTPFSRTILSGFIRRSFARDTEAVHLGE